MNDCPEWPDSVGMSGADAASFSGSPGCHIFIAPDDLPFFSMTEEQYNRMVEAQRMVRPTMRIYGASVPGSHPKEIIPMPPLAEELRSRIARDIKEKLECGTRWQVLRWLESHPVDDVIIHRGAAGGGKRFAFAAETAVPHSWRRMVRVLRRHKRRQAKRGAAK